MVVDGPDLKLFDRLGVMASRDAAEPQVTADQSRSPAALATLRS